MTLPAVVGIFSIFVSMEATQEEQETAIISLANAQLFQQDHLVLSNVNLEIRKGEFVYVIGKTGSGKSSLLKTLYAELDLLHGTGEVAGFPLSKLKRRKIPYLRRRLGIVFQDFQLLTDRSVTDNLMFVMKATGWKDKIGMSAQIKNVLDKVELGNKGFKFPHELSGGEQQRVAIARALVNDPDIILADEPTGNLDPETTDGIMRLLFQISKNGRAIIMATHDYEIIRRFPSRTIKCEGERLIELADPTAIWFMLSILIPIFNFDVRSFVSELSRQAVELQVPFEILCYDDCSEAIFKKANANITSYAGVFYKELDHNIGRSAIRNKLAEQAKHPFLLFLDCDSKILSSRFVQSYVDCAKPNQVACGGRVYAVTPPSDPALLLHWTVGSNRETMAAQERQNSPHKSFMTNNFFLPKDTFLSIKMDESLTKYGHEDTLFGAQLKQQKIAILHIENPLCHIGLEPAAEFLFKTRQGLENLHNLIGRGLASREIKLYRYYRRAKRWHLNKRIVRKFEAQHEQWEQSLAAASPNLSIFDLYKLGYLLSLDFQSKSA